MSLHQSSIRPGRTLLAQGQVEAAIKDFRLAIKKAPGSAEAHEWLGWAYLAKHDLDKAIASFDKSYALGTPGNRVVLQAQCATYLSLMPRYDLAISKFNERCREYPDLRWALIVLRGSEARSQFLANPDIAIYFVCRPRADSGVAPNLVASLTSDWNRHPEAASTLAGRAIAAALKSDWQTARDKALAAIEVLAEQQEFEKNRIPASEFLKVP